MGLPLVSVVIPTHNREHLLAEALDSVFSQDGIDSLFSLEVVVVDDASTDGTARTMLRYPKATYIRLATPSGPSVARNERVTASTLLSSMMTTSGFHIGWRCRCPSWSRTRWSASSTVSTS